MNKSRYSFLFAGWLALTLALLPVLRAQEAPPAPPAPTAEDVLLLREIRDALKK
mgnify:CR=1 FL=1